MSQHCYIYTCMYVYIYIYIYACNKIQHSNHIWRELNSSNWLWMYNLGTYVFDLPKDRSLQLQLHPKKSIFRWDINGCNIATYLYVTVLGHIWGVIHFSLTADPVVRGCSIHRSLITCIPNIHNGNSHPWKFTNLFFPLNIPFLQNRYSHIFSEQCLFFTHWLFSSKGLISIMKIQSFLHNGKKHTTRNLYWHRPPGC